MTASAASATRLDRMPSDPGCFEASEDETAVASCSCVGSGDEATVSLTRPVL